MMERLAEYHRKRDFHLTAEPFGSKRSKKKEALTFVVQKHGARRLHYDFRLEWDGVMKSWAVTRGPSFDPADKRLAVRTEDHPVGYNAFEGVIPDKQYGAGPVMIWDKGVWVPEHDPHEGEKKGHLIFTLEGERLKGRCHLVRMKDRSGNGKKENWLLIKGDDEHATAADEAEAYLAREGASVISGRTLEEIRDGTFTDTSAGNGSFAGSPGLLARMQKKYPGPELATLVDLPPDSGQWLHEIKYDGYRVMMFVSREGVVIRTRGLKDWTHKFPLIADEIKRIPVGNAVFDGEIAVLDDRGATSFSALQEALSKGDVQNIEAWIFDLLYLDGKDFSARPLLERKGVLEKVLKKRKLSRIHYSPHFESSPRLLEEACKIGAEGIMSKLKDAPYRSRRTQDWLKSKCGLEQEFVIGGYMPAKGDAKAVGALLLGYYKGKDLHYAGRVGTGFSQEMAKKVFQKLEPLRTEASPFCDRVEKSRRRHYWVKPQVICEVSFWEWTAGKHIRHTSFRGLREDKQPEAVREEIPEKISRLKPKRASGRGAFTIEGVAISHPDREVYSGKGITKGDVARHYGKIAPYILPFIENRLISLLRCTDKVGGECFFQRGPMKGAGTGVMTSTVSHNGKKHNYIYVDSPQGLLELVQMGAVEIHAWQSKVGSNGYPDQIIFDLDPGEGVPFEAVKLAAEDVRRRLKKIGIVSFPRLSGGKGIHVAAAIHPEFTWDEVKAFTRKFAMEMERDMPEAYVATMAKKKRDGKIFVDYLRNDFSATAIAPFSLRAREGAPVAVPVSWRELAAVSSPVAYTIGNIGRRTNKAMEKIIDDFFQSRQNLGI